MILEKMRIGEMNTRVIGRGINHNFREQTCPAKDLEARHNTRHHTCLCKSKDTGDSGLASDYLVASRCLRIPLWPPISALRPFVPFRDMMP